MNNSNLADDCTDGPAPGPDLAVIIPTFNESDNVRELIERLKQSLAGCSWEVIFVDDDSPDGTAGVVREMGRNDVRVRCVQRIGRRGLSSACVEGMLATTAAYFAVMDGDLQHDERLLPQMLGMLRAGGTDIVVGSRYTRGGAVGEWDTKRVEISRFATRLSRAVVPAGLADPMSGFFMLRRELFEASVRKLSGIGFKLLVDLFASAPQPPKFKEIPYEFRSRRAGSSKLDSAVAWDYGLLLIDKLVGRFLPARFVAFAVVGVLGIAVHFLVLILAFRVLHYSFSVGQGAATGIAMTFNYWLNNIVTYSDMRLRGWRWLRGWMWFVAVCSIGAVANIGVASYLFRWRGVWVPAALAGIVVSSVWNFVATSIFIWAKPRRA